MMKKLAKGLVALITLYFSLALVLVFLPGAGHSQRASEMRKAIDTGELTREEAAASFAAMGGPSGEQVYPFEPLSFTMADGTRIYSRFFPGSSSKTIVLVHGLDGSSANFNTTAGLMRDATGTSVVAMDLRGHGRSGGNRWDVDFIGQYESDVAEVITAVHKARPGGTVVLAGHSMGGGIALRFAQLEERPDVAGYLLFAPALGQSAPTTRQGPPPDDAMPEGLDEDYAALRLPRIIGLIMLNGVGVTGFNHLPVLFVNLSPDPSAYTYAAMINSSPVDYIGALESVDKPLLVIVGSDDQPFLATEFEPVISAHTSGQTLILDGEDHNSVHASEEAIAAVKSWLGNL